MSEVISAQEYFPSATDIISLTFIINILQNFKGGHFCTWEADRGRHASLPPPPFFIVHLTFKMIFIKRTKGVVFHLLIHFNFFFVYLYGFLC